MALWTLTLIPFSAYEGLWQGYNLSFSTYCKQFSKMTVPINIPTRNVWELGVVNLLNFSHPCGLIVVSYTLEFAYWLFIYAVFRCFCWKFCLSFLFLTVTCRSSLYILNASTCPPSGVVLSVSSSCLYLAFLPCSQKLRLGIQLSS